MYKMTLVDVLSTLDESPQIWNARADYWDNRAAPHDRVNRDEQAARIRANVVLMRDRAAKMTTRYRPRGTGDRETRESRDSTRRNFPRSRIGPHWSMRCPVTKVTGGFKSRDKGNPTIAETMVRSRAKTPRIESPESMH